MTIPRINIKVADRLRADYGNIDELIESIRRFGILQPLLIDKDHNLIAGGRRYEAATQLGLEEVPVHYSHEVTERDKLMMEIEENVMRKEMTWQETVLAIHRIHGLASDGQHEWSMERTGALCGQSRASVSLAIRAADAILKEDEEVKNATGLKDVLRIFSKRQHKKATEQFRALAAAESASRRAKQAEAHVPQPIAPIQAKVIPSDAFKAPMVVDLARQFYHGDFREILSKFPRACVDHVVTDIPYGVDMEDFEGFKNIELVKDQHDVEQNLSLMPAFLNESFRIVRDGGFCVFWYDVQHHEKLTAWASSAGWAVQPWPLVWCKEHACRNMAAAFNFTKATEYAMVCRKPGATLVKHQPVNYVSASGSEVRQKFDNPFAKPLKVWQFIYHAIATPGQTVLDPFAGEMSSALAAISLDLTPICVELVKEHFDKGVEHCKTAYRKHTRYNVSFVE